MPDFEHPAAPLFSGALKGSMVSIERILFKVLQQINTSLDVLLGRALKDTPVFLSFDVEALLIRAPDDHVNRLIWGKTATGEYGIRRLSNILRQHRLKGNFLIDLAACHIHGEGKVREVFDFLLSEGHEVHAHLHPEMLADSWQFGKIGVRGRRFNDLDQFMSVSLLTYTARKFRELAEREPFLFRSGSYLFNRHTIYAAKKAGFSALSNYSVRRNDSILDMESPAREMNPFCWDNGVMEMPVDISSPEKLTWLEFHKRWSKAHRSKASKTFNLVSHSWTLLKRDENDHFTIHAPELEERFHQICAGLSGNARVMGYEEYLRENPPEAVVCSRQLPATEAFNIKRAKRCTACLAIMSPAVLEENRCINCNSTQIIEFNTASYRRALIAKRNRRKVRARVSRPNASESAEGV